MIRFRLECLEKGILKSGTKTTEIFDYIVPRPKLILKKNNREENVLELLQFPNNINIKVSGKFLSMKEVPKRQNLYNLPEPNWNLEQFIENCWNIICDDYFHKELRHKGFSLKLESAIKKLEIDERELDLMKSIPMEYQSQAYGIFCDEKSVSLISWTMTGMYYAFLTFAQLLLVELDNNKVSEIEDSTLEGNSNKIAIFFPRCDIIDYPDYEFRGFEDDISRGQRPTLEEFKDFIKLLSLLKLNIEGLYIEDIFKFKKYPQIGEGRGPLTAEDIRELQDYARNWFVDVQPAVEMFGHMDNILTMPEFRKYGEFPGSQCLDITSVEAKQFADDLLKEICDAFDTKLIHLICDESFDSGLGSSREYQKKHGKAETINDWFKFLVKTVQKYGKSTAGFAHDAFIHYPKLMKLARDYVKIILYWSYSDAKKYRKISKLVKNGFDVGIVCTTFDWSRHYPFIEYAEKNTCYMALDGLKRGAKYMISTKFGDFFNENLRENIKYGIFLISQATWNTRSPNIFKFKDLKNFSDKDPELNTDILKRAYCHFYFGIKKPIESISGDINDVSNNRDIIKFSPVDKLIKIMDTLGNQNRFLPTFPNGMFNRFWMDPYCRKIKNKEIKYLNQFLKEDVEILKDIKELKENNLLKRNKHHSEYIEFSARMSLHYAVKYLSAEAAWSKKFKLIHPIFKNLSDLMAVGLIPRENSFDEIISKINGNNNQKYFKISNYKQLIPVFEWLRKDIMELRELYKRLWLKQAIKEGLEYPYHRFEVLDWYYQNTIEDLEKNQRPRDNQLKSEWIWIGTRRLTANWGNRKHYIFFKTFNVATINSSNSNKTISIDSEQSNNNNQRQIRSAKIQGIASNYMDIYLNGNHVGEVLSRFSLSQLPMAKSVQVFDVTDYIKEGTNYLTIDACNYVNGIGGINIILRIEYNDNSFEEIISDESWRYIDIDLIDFQEIKNKNTSLEYLEEILNNKKLRKVRSFGRPPLGNNGPISRPNWTKNWKSEISFSFGARNFVETSMVTFIGELPYKILFPLVPIGFKILNIDIFGFRKI
ncbi:MAG: family 20 glycosylhydrolase [Promethearchaeota archaeon]